MSLERSADRFALLEQRMSHAAHAGCASSSQDASSTPMIQQSIGFSVSRERSLPGAADAVSPQGAGTPSSHERQGGGAAPPAFGSLATSTIWKRKRPPSPVGAEAPGYPGVRTPSPSQQKARHSQEGLPTSAAAGVQSNSGVATHSPLASHNSHSAELARVHHALREQQERVEQLEHDREVELAELNATRKSLDEREEELERAKVALRAEESSAANARADLDTARLEVEASRGAMSGMRVEIEGIRTEQEAEAARQVKGREALREALRERCFRERAAAKERLARECVRLGTLEPDTKAFGAAGG